MNRETARRAQVSFSRRVGIGAPVRRDFLLAKDDEQSPLGVLLSGADKGGGGRGGKTRIALLLTLLWKLAKSPHTTTKPAYYWATLMGLEDPSGAGARTVRNTLRELERRGFISMNGRSPGAVPEVTLMNEALTNDEYRLPFLQSLEEGSTRRSLYFRVPDSFWNEGLCNSLSGAGMAMYLIGMSRAGWGDRNEFWISPQRFKSE